ncbi:hypothetical protein [Wolbachia endosymbiont (group B) of Scrobipalpa ocellatella]|uniref:hypothetical protein n=1 Tax=Wolbachia endosymbiont (group B) of Scrobipalpa ocellatella TaxID=3139320 RepID=UPI00345EB118
MNLRLIQEETKEIPFCTTPYSLHYEIRRPLMEMFGLGSKKGCCSNPYTGKCMITDNKLAPIVQLTQGVDADIVIDNTTKTVYAKEIKNKQQKIDLIYDKDRIGAKEVHDIQLLKAGKRVTIPSKYKSFEDYRRELQKKSSYIVIRAEVTQHLDHSGKLLNDPIESVVHYTTFPKLKGNTLDYKYFARSRKLIGSRKSELQDKFKNVVKLNALMAAKHKEGLSIVVPNAFLSGLSNDEQKEAKIAFVNAEIEAAKEIEQDSGKYSGFCGIFVNTGNTQDLNKLISDSGIKSIAINYGDLSAPSRVSKEGKFAESIMGEGVGYVGNGALSARGNIAVEENLTRRTLGETVLMFSGAFNEKVLDKNCYRGENVKSDRVQNKTQNIQRHRSTVYFTLSASLSALIIALAFVTQTYIFLAALIVPAVIGLCGWSLYEKEKGDKPSSNIQNNVKAERALDSYRDTQTN